MKLTQEQYDELPDFLKDAYVKDGDGYVTEDSLKVASLKGSLDNLDLKMKAEERERDEKVRLAAEQAREEALEEAKNKNNVDDILRIEREKLEDEQARIESQREELKGVKQALADEKLANVIDSLAVHAVTKLKGAFKILIKQYVNVDINTREVTYLNEDGSASSLDQQGFIKDLAKRETFAEFIKGSTPTSGSGLADGGQSGSAVAKNPKEMTSKERLEFKNADPIGFKQAFNL